MNHPVTAPKNAMNAISSAMKLILCPEPGRPVLPAPEGYHVSSYGAGNQVATVWVVNMTETPPTCQGVSHETGSVIANGLPQAIAEAVLSIYKVHGIDAAIAVMIQLGYKDLYTTPYSFIQESLSSAGTMLDARTGVVKRDTRDIKLVWREAGNFFVLNDKNEPPRLIRDIELVRDYRNTDGSQVDLGLVPLAIRDDETVVV